MKKLFIHLFLFIITFITTTLAGIEWTAPAGLPFWESVPYGIEFSIPFLLILTAHEFGHYFVAKYYGVKTSLPYYIPMYLFGYSLSIGTMGAFIKMKERPASKKQLFDIGIAGPLAGFIVAIGVLVYGFVNLPSMDYLYLRHPEYKNVGMDIDKKAYNYQFINQYHQVAFEEAKSKGILDSSTVYKSPEEYNLLALGDNLIVKFMRMITPAGTWFPNNLELYHYPWLFAGYLALFFTALNLLPIGQLDGGHIIYGLVGEAKHRIVSVSIFLGLVFWAGLGIITPFMAREDIMMYLPLYGFFLYVIFHQVHDNKLTRIIIVLVMIILQMGISWTFPQIEGYNGWIVYAFMLGRLMGIKHPPTLIEEPLDFKRKLLGCISLIIFVLCVTPEPFIEVILKP